MNQVGNIAKISILVTPVVTSGIPLSASPTDYPKKSGLRMLLVETTISQETPTFIKYFGVDIPSALGRRVVVTQTLTAENDTNLKDFTYRGTQRSRRVTRTQPKGEVLISKEAPSSSSCAQAKKNVEIQEIFSVPNSISPSEYKVGKLVTAAAIAGNQVVIFRILKAILKSAVLMPRWRNTTGSTDKFVQRTKIGSKDVLLRLITNTSKNSLKVAGIEK